LNVGVLAALISPVTWAKNHPDQPFYSKMKLYLCAFVNRFQKAHVRQAEFERIDAARAKETTAIGHDSKLEHKH
jgi:hypothetical protein